MARRPRHGLLVVSLLGIVAAMGGLTYASVPLYRLFCQVTGFGGATQQASVAPAPVPGRTVTVRFDANVYGDLPWSFVPAEKVITLDVGEDGRAFYRAANLSQETIVGTATFNVTPFVVGPYFNKMQCFCFEEQELAPGENAELAVEFFVDPAMLEDPETADIRTITLSYTFFRAGDAARLSRAAAGGDGVY